MTQPERLSYLIEYLKGESADLKGIATPEEEPARKRLLRSLMNIRPPKAIAKDFLAIQDAFLQEETERKGITGLADLTPVQEGVSLWRGDITTLRCDAIVNAANSRMLGCFVPCHDCIDNQIHTFSGIQLRTACAELMKEQGHEEETGRAKITPAYNLPCKYVLHTVGPIVCGGLTKRDKDLLASCYRSCLELADANGVQSIAFCCISTGEFRFPNDKAAQIAVKTVKEYKAQTNSKIEVIFNVFKELDWRIYRQLLGADRKAEWRD